MLKKPQPAVVTIGSMDQLKAAKPGNGERVTIRDASGNGGNGHSNGNSAASGTEKPEAAQTVASE